MSAVSTSSTSRQAAALLAFAAASTSSAAAESTSAAAMDAESDDGEPKLEIVDEPMSEEGGSDFSGKSFPPLPQPNSNAAFRKSVSYDGSESSSGTTAAVARRMRSIVEETNANEAIESLLMLGREPVVSPQSREVTCWLVEEYLLQMMMCST